MKYEVIRKLINGDIEADGQTFDTVEEAQEWADYTERMLTPEEKEKYTDFVVMKVEE